MPDEIPGQRGISESNRGEVILKKVGSALLCSRSWADAALKSSKDDVFRVCGIA
jgi:hypothetical protein